MISTSHSEWADRCRRGRFIRAGNQQGREGFDFSRTATPWKRRPALAAEGTRSAKRPVCPKIPEDKLPAAVELPHSS